MRKSDKLIKEACTCEMHLDMLYDVLLKHRNGRKNVIAEDYLPDFKRGGVNVVVSSLYVDDNGSKDAMLREILLQIAVFYEELDSCNGEFVLATDYDDIVKAKSQNRVAVMLSFEGVDMLDGDVELLRTFYQLGVRLIGLCWSRPNWAADGCDYFFSKDVDVANAGYGVTEKGKELLRFAQQKKMIVDVSHINDKSFWDVMDVVKTPVIASHSNCRSLSDTPRNLSDMQIRAIVERNGVIGVNGTNLLVNFENKKAADLDMLVEHMIHEKRIGGAHCIGIGLDQVDRIIEYDENDELCSRDIIPTHDMMPQLTDLLISKGFTDDEIKGILGNNFIRVVKEVLG